MTSRADCAIRTWLESSISPPHLTTMLHASKAWGEARYGQIPDILSHARNKNQREASIFKASLAFEYLRAAALRSHFSDKKNALLRYSFSMHSSSPPSGD